MSDWKNLPFYVLVSIFKLLNVHDRHNAGQVCSSWKEACLYPGIWSEISFNSRTDLCNRLPLVKRMLLKFGCHIRKLSLVGDATYSASFTYRTTPDFWKTLCDIGLQLQSLSLYNLGSSSSVTASTNLHFDTFIRSQLILESLTLRKVQFTGLEWMLLLEALRNPEGHINKLKSLTITGGPPQFLIIGNDPLYLNGLAMCENLQFLSLDYKICSDSALMVLAEHVRGKLQTFNITFSKPFSIILSDNAWSTLLLACPTLKVGFNFKSCSIHSNILQVMNPKIPLQNLKLSCSFAQSTKLSIERFLLHVVSLYTPSLENLTVKLKDNAEYLDKTLISVITNCTCLKSFNFSGVIREFSTVWRICDYLYKHPSRFQRYYASPRYLNNYNYMNFKEHYNVYQRNLQDKNVNLTVEDPRLG